MVAPSAAGNPWNFRDDVVAVDDSGKSMPLQMKGDMFIRLSNGRESVVRVAESAIVFESGQQHDIDSTFEVRLTIRAGLRPDRILLTFESSVNSDAASARTTKYLAIPAASEIRDVADSAFVPVEEFQEQLDVLAEERGSDLSHFGGAIMIAACGITVGYMLWMWNAGRLLLSGTSSFPAFATFENVAVFECVDRVAAKVEDGEEVFSSSP
jgi:hypothetical protein